VGQEGETAQSAKGQHPVGEREGIQVSGELGTLRSQASRASTEGTLVGARLARKSIDEVYQTNRVIVLRGQARLQQVQLVFVGAVLARESVHEVYQPNRVVVLRRQARLQQVQLVFVGAVLARDKSNPVSLIERSACIAGKPRSHNKWHFRQHIRQTQSLLLDRHFRETCPSLAPANPGH